MNIRPPAVATEEIVVGGDTKGEVDAAPIVPGLAICGFGAPGLGVGCRVQGLEFRFRGIGCSGLLDPES